MTRLGPYVRAGGACRALLFIAPLLLLPLAGCQDNSGGDTIVVNGLDCGLIRNDLAGGWSVTFIADQATTINCDNPALNTTAVDFDGTTVIYNNITSFPSPSGASFNVVGSGPNLSNELIASVEADSCLALVQKWEEDDQGWVTCLGTLDRANSIIPLACDSIDLDTDADGVADTSCDLNHRVSGQAATP